MSRLIKKFEMIAVFETVSNATVASLKISVIWSSGSWGGIFLEIWRSVSTKSDVFFDLNLEGSSKVSYNKSLVFVDETYRTF